MQILSEQTYNHGTLAHRGMWPPFCPKKYQWNPNRLWKLVKLVFYPHTNKKTDNDMLKINKRSKKQKHRDRSGRGSWNKKVHHFTVGEFIVRARSAWTIQLLGQRPNIYLTVGDFFVRARSAPVRHARCRRVFIPDRLYNTVGRPNAESLARSGAYSGHEAPSARRESSVIFGFHSRPRRALIQGKTCTIQLAGRRPNVYLVVGEFVFFGRKAWSACTIQFVGWRPNY